ncbi:hypothetical protein Q1695_007328 [Nippostrongylus brasiliensis]|nr:hypothetical protein Q1695_007328 [Nippostrongylus brasiliensis]
MVLFVAIDRLIATIFPIWHFKQEKNYMITLCSIPFIISGIITIVNYYLVRTYNSDVNVDTRCYDHVYPSLEIFVTAHRCGCIVLSAVIYVVVLLLLNKKFSKASVGNINNELNRQQQKSMHHATVTIGLSTLNAVILMLAPDILIAMQVFGRGTTYLLLRSLVLNKIMVNFVLFVTRHSEFRRLICSLVQKTSKIDSHFVVWSRRSREQPNTPTVVQF